MNVVLSSIALGPGHCCVCSVVCHHIGPIRLCVDHQSTTNQKENPR